jgi:hypothetical protein
MNETLFLRLLTYEEKSSILVDVIKEIHTGHNLNTIVYPVDVHSFNKIPGSPFAYWVS